MGLFSGIMSKISGHAPAAQPAASAPAPAPVPAMSMASASASLPPAPAPPPPPAPVIDITAILDDLAARNGEDLAWRSSIVDLMKLVDIDSSLTARRELARELEYPGDMGDSAKMNVWLHRAVIQKLAANGGQVPADLLI